MRRVKTSDLSDPSPICREVVIPPHGLEGRLTIPENCRGLILFAHGSGSSRFSPRNNMVAAKLNAQGFATLLFDLLRPEEGQDVRAVFDIPLLAGRLGEATEWARGQAELQSLPLGYFGASTGAGAALAAAVQPGCSIAAIVSRGGRPDLVNREVIDALRAPTLLIVGGEDHDVLAMNEKVLLNLTCPAAIEIVPHSGHLFEEPGALEKVADLAADWFERYMKSGTKARDES